jgi:phasin family protein
MTIQNDVFANFANFQKEALEPIRAANTIVAETFERLTRQNYAVLGDFVNFAVESVRLPSKATDYSEFLTRQMETARAFGEQAVRRSQEYVEIVTAIQAKAQATAQPATQAPATKAKAA